MAGSLKPAQCAARPCRVVSLWAGLCCSRPFPCTKFVCAARRVVQPAPEPVVAPPLSDVGGKADWPTLGDAKQPLKKRERAGDAAASTSQVCPGSEGGGYLPSPLAYCRATRPPNRRCVRNERQGHHRISPPPAPCFCMTHAGRPLCHQGQGQGRAQPRKGGQGGQARAAA